MKLKKANAVLGLLSIVILLAHAGYQVIAYILLIYQPKVTMVLGWATVAVVSLHAVLGMSIVFFAHDGSRLKEYPKSNMRTILQRASAVGIMVMLVLHIQSFSILHAGALGLAAAELIQVIFFSCIFTHTAVSLTNAFVTLGLLEDMEKKKKIDKAVWVICLVLWLISVLVVGRTYMVLASMS